MSFSYIFVPLVLFSVSFILAVLIAGFLVPFLTHRKIGQVIREEGPQSHHAKAGTPTMGGFIFIVPFLIISLGYLFVHFSFLILLGILSIFAVLGYIDDAKIVLKNSNKGLSVRLRLAIQLGIGLLLGIIIYVSRLHSGIAPGITSIPYTQISINLSFFYIFFVAVIFAGMVNAVNLTDGLDGLAGTISVITITSFLFIFVLMDHFAPWYPIIAMLLAGLMVFLYFNRYPAKIFMGNVGSLFLGAFIATMALMSGLELFLIPFGIIFIAETLSVLIQVAYFKATKALSKTKEGKRFFRMSPIHHHFELSGWHETKVVKVFAITQIIVSLFAIAVFAWFRYFGNA